MRDDLMEVTTDGDKLVIETAFGEATFELSDDAERANDALIGGDDWLDKPLEERWHILIEEVETAAELKALGEL